MGANAATIQNLISRHSGPHIRSPSSQHLSNTISRQVHNADFSSDSSSLSGSQSSSAGSPPTSGSAGSSSFTDPGASRRAVAADPDSDTIASDTNGDVDDQTEDLDAQSLDGVLSTTVSVLFFYLILTLPYLFRFRIMAQRVRRCESRRRLHSVAGKRPCRWMRPMTVAIPRLLRRPHLG
jgi:hypothetical protein